MTDNDIIKALECCSKQNQCNEECPLCDLDNLAYCIHTLIGNALDLINRLQKENKITREYLHDNGLEWDLLSYSKRKEHNECPIL